MPLDSTRRFCRQVLQLWPDLSFPSNAELLENQDALYRALFSDAAKPCPLPKHYELRVLKDLVARIEASIEDWDQHVSRAVDTLGSPG